MQILLKFFRLAIFTVVFLAAMTLVVEIPSRYIPWRAIDLADAPTLLTARKLRMLADDANACNFALHRAALTFKTLASATHGNCPLDNITLMTGSRYSFSAAPRANCGVVAALHIWERDVVGPAAARHLKTPVSRIDHIGIFSCRNVRGSSSRRSQHATARAIDISGFHLADGRLISVRRDWGGNTPQGRFLRDVHASSCKIFSGVLGPDYNALHADHFHLDLGPYRICR